MHRIGRQTLTVTLTCGLSVAGISYEGQVKPSEPLRSARAAIGGEDRIAGVRSLALKGTRRTRNLAFRRGDGGSPEFVDNECEFRILLPDHVLRIDHRGLSGRRSVTGFRGKEGLRGGEAPEFERLFAGRLLLAMLLRSETIVPLQLQPAPTDGYELTFGSGQLITTVVLAQASSLPVKLRHRQAKADGTGDQEVSWVLGERHIVAGLSLPHRLERIVDGRLFDVFQFRSIQVNPSLTAEDFKVSDEPQRERSCNECAAEAAAFFPSLRATAHRSFRKS